MALIKMLAASGVLAAGLCLSAIADDATPLDDTILILDASGSMWGQIDGTNKIVIAKDTVEGLVRGLHEDQRHRPAASGIGARYVHCCRLG
ncbi:hypothetical protein [Hyphomonas sp.]|uniref:hypothetical protein n=1 Tax=Hyphomonas sp. TaxID=87 RepID=UPI0032ED5F05